MCASLLRAKRAEQKQLIARVDYYYFDSYFNHYCSSSAQRVELFLKQLLCLNGIT